MVCPGAGAEFQGGEGGVARVARSRRRKYHPQNCEGGAVVKYANPVKDRYSRDLLHRFPVLLHKKRGSPPKWRVTCKATLRARLSPHLAYRTPTQLMGSSQSQGSAGVGTSHPRDAFDLRIIDFPLVDET